MQAGEKKEEKSAEEKRHQKEAEQKCLPQRSPNRNVFFSFFFGRLLTQGAVWPAYLGL